MYNKVTVLGLGTLGGFLCKNISELDCVKELIIVDHDIVEGKNVFQSIYSSTNIGEYKVNALADIINDDVAVTKINQCYVEGTTSLPKSDLVIDCRDVVCNRKTEIDVRFYISGKILIIDCRQNVYNKQSYNGAYSVNLTKGEINKATFFASQIIENGDIKNMILNKLVQKVDLNLLKDIMRESMKRSLDNRIDMIYEATGTSQQLQCINENVKPILDLNKHQDVEVFIGERTNALQRKIIEFPKIAKLNYAVIPQNSLKDSFDVIKSLTDLIDLQNGISNFIVTIRKRNGQKYVELLEETGAA